MPTYSKEFLNKTIDVWRPYREEPLSLQEAEETISNMTSLFRLIESLENKYCVPAYHNLNLEKRS